jgi:hypothetical protein
LCILHQPGTLIGIVRNPHSVIASDRIPRQMIICGFEQLRSLFLDGRLFVSPRRLARRTRAISKLLLLP